MANDSGTVLALISCPNADAAAALANALVDSELAGCVNIIPGIQSVYRWRGAIESDSESLLLIKTACKHVEAVERFIEKNHPYECPELVVLEATHVREAYNSWLHDSIKS